MLTLDHHERPREDHAERRRRMRLMGAERPLAGAASWYEHTEVDEPCTAVEFGVDGLDLPCASLGWDSLHDDVASNILWARARVGAPADDDGVAVVPDVELLERNGWLRALASLELRQRRERCGVKILWASAAAVDQGIDRGGVVHEVGREGSLGGRIAVVGDEAGEVGRNRLGLGSAHALAGTALNELVCEWLGEDASEHGRGRNNGGEGTHSDFDYWSWRVKVVMVVQNCF